MCDCLSKNHHSSEEREKIDVFQARVGNVDPEYRLRLIFGELQELENDVSQRSQKSRKKSDQFWWFEAIFSICVIGGSASITIVTAFTDEKNIPVIVLGALMFFVGTLHKFLKLGDRGFTYRQGNNRLQKVRQQIRDIIYRFQNYTNEQLLVLISEIRNSIDDIDLELYRSNMTGNVQFDNDFNIVINPQPQAQSQDGEVPFVEPRPSEIHIHLDSQNSSPNGSQNHTPRQSPYFKRNIQRLASVKASSDSQIPRQMNSLEVPRKKAKENQHSMPVLQVSEDSES